MKLEFNPTRRNIRWVVFLERAREPELIVNRSLLCTRACFVSVVLVNLWHEQFEIPIFQEKEKLLLRFEKLLDHNQNS